MKFKLFCAGLAAAFLPPAIASAAEAPAAAASAAIDVGSQLYSSDGARIGRIERLVKSKDGTPQSVAVIYSTKFVYIPYATLSKDEKGVVTSLTRKEVRKL